MLSALLEVAWSGETLTPDPTVLTAAEEAETPAEGHLWNVNFPDPGDHVEPVPEIVEAPLDRGPLAYEFEIVDGNRYTFRGRYHERSRTPGSDVDVCFSGRISVTHLPEAGRACRRMRPSSCVE